jgi:hypothetical protein
MNCRRCGKSITEYTFAHHARRCVRLFFTEGEFVFILGLFLIPIFIAYELIRELWQTLRPVPFKRHEILRLMSPYFGVSGATEYVNGLKCGFVERPYLRRCGYGRAFNSVGKSRSR